MKKIRKSGKQSKFAYTAKLAWITFLLCFSALPVFALNISYGDEDPVTVKGIDETEDQIMAGEFCSFTGKAGDLIIFAQDITVDGETTFSGILVGNNVRILKDIGNDLYAAGSNIEIDKNIGDNAYLFGEDLSIGSDSVVNGTVIATGKELIIYGEVMGDLYAGVGYLTINGTVHGDVYAGASRITIADGGSIKGNLTYSAEKKLSEKEKGRVNGGVFFKEEGVFGCKEKDLEQNSGKGPGFSSPPRPNRGFMFGFRIISLFCILTAGLLILLFPGIGKIYKEKRTPARFGQTVLWGLIPLLIYPVLAGILMINPPLGGSLFLIAFPLFGLTTIFGLTLTGQFLFTLFKWNSDSRFLNFLFGCAVFIPVLAIPFISTIAIFAVSALGWGVILEILFSTKFGTKTSNPAPAQIEARAEIKQEGEKKEEEFKDNNKPEK